MNSAREISLRPATADDAPTIVHHRRVMFREMGYLDESALETMAARFLPWLREKMQADEYLGWLAITDDGRVVAGAGLWLMDWPAHIVGKSERRGNILNVYTEPEFRRRGLARRLTKAALDWCRANGVDYVILHASEEGRPVYESLGFQPSNEMRLKII